MLRRKIRDAGDARACMEAVQASGLTRREWARQNGVDGRSLNVWRLNLERSANRDVLPRLVELVARTPPTATLRVWCGPFVVEVDQDFDAELLRRVLAAVSSC